MENKKVNLTEFVKNYLTILGISADKLDENTGKVLCTAILSMLKEINLDEEQEKKIEETAFLLKQNNSQENLEVLKKVFTDLNVDWQSSFVEKLISYLLDMTDRLDDSLTEEKKKQLAELINSMAD